MGVKVVQEEQVGSKIPDGTASRIETADHSCGSQRGVTSTEYTQNTQYNKGVCR